MKPADIKKVLDIRFTPVHDRDSISFYSPMLALATLPVRDPKLPPGENTWSKDCGRARIELVAAWDRDKKGNIIRDKDTNLPTAAFPYGALPRLALVWLISEVVRTKRRRIPLGKSIQKFLMDVGYTKDVRNYRNLEKQLKRLFQSELTIHTYGAIEKDGNKYKGSAWQCNRIATETSLWWSPDGKEEGLFESSVKVSEEFYNGVLAHGFPIDFDIVKLFHSQPFVLDIYFWMAYRLHTVNQKDLVENIPWAALSWQFGNISDIKNFKRKFRSALALIQKPWSGLKANCDRHGINIAPSPLSVPASFQLDSEPKPLPGELN